MKTNLSSPRGQAAAELVLCIPLLMLMAAGIFQFALLSVCRIQFDDACGQVAREWASGARKSPNLADGVRASLGSFGKFFDDRSFRMEPVGTDPEKTSRNQLLGDAGRLGPFMNRLGHTAFDYSRGRWRLSARFKSRPLFGLIFPRGVVFQTEICVLRHPAEAP